VWGQQWKEAPNVPRKRGIELLSRIKDFLRSHPFEVEDASWFPGTWRSFMTDYLRALFDLTGIYNCIIPHLVDALRAARRRIIIDGCSGSGGPIISLRPLLAKALGEQLSLVLTDKYPNAVIGNDPLVSYHPYPADAASMPDSLSGFRTLFTSFHHFPSSSAKKILADAVDAGNGIAIFEVTQCDLRHFLLVMLTPIYVLILGPFMRPISLSRMFWTYLIPVIPFFSWWDGIVSNLRSYSEEELKAIVSDFPTYNWSIGTAGKEQLAPVLFVIGVKIPQS